LETGRGLGVVASNASSNGAGQISFRTQEISASWDGGAVGGGGIVAYGGRTGDGITTPISYKACLASTSCGFNALILVAGLIIYARVTDLAADRGGAVKLGNAGDGGVDRAQDPHIGVGVVVARVVREIGGVIARSKSRGAGSAPDETFTKSAIGKAPTETLPRVTTCSKFRDLVARLGVVVTAPTTGAGLSVHITTLKAIILGVCTHNQRQS